MGLTRAAGRSRDRIEDRFFGGRTDWEEPLVQARIQARSSDVSSAVERLHHDTSNGLGGSVGAQNYDGVFANFATLRLCDRNGGVVGFRRNGKYNLAARIRRHSEKVK